MGLSKKVKCTLKVGQVKHYPVIERGCPKSRIAPFAIVYFGKKNYLTVAKKQTL